MNKEKLAKYLYKNSKILISPEGKVITPEELQMINIEEIDVKL